MVRKSFLLATGQQMEYEVLCPVAVDPKKPMPFLVSVSGRDQLHVNGFSQRLMSESWVVVMALRPKTAPLLFLGSGEKGDGVWHLHELCSHLSKEFAVAGGRFLLTGVSNGGNSVLRFATLWPELCCGVVVATGSLQGLVELPGGCRRMRGVPVDMYVGTKDECGFYNPMVALESHFREVGHKPVASLTIFQDAGHVCSPLIDAYLIHGKIGLMLLHAGVTGSCITLSVPRTATRPSEKILAKLTTFAGELGLQCQKAADGSLQVSAAGGGGGGAAVAGAPLLTMTLPPIKHGAAAAPPLPPATSFKVDDRVEVWSNSKQRWESGQVVRTSEGEEGGVQVVFEDERGKLSKMIPWAAVQDYLRRPAGADGTVPCAEGFSVGDRVAIWSSSNRKWIQDGQVSTISLEKGLTVVYSDGSLSKLIPLPNAAQYLRRPGFDDEESPQGRLPNGPSNRLLQPGGEPGGSRPSSASRSPASADPSPASRNATKHVPSQAPSRAGTKQASEQAGLLAQFPARCRVAIWSESNRKWFEDGQVAEVTEEAVTVVYAGGSMQKMVVPPFVAQCLRRLPAAGA